MHDWQKPSPFLVRVQGSELETAGLKVLSSYNSNSRDNPATCAFVAVDAEVVTKLTCSSAR